MVSKLPAIHTLMCYFGYFLLHTVENLREFLDEYWKIQSLAYLCPDLGITSEHEIM